VGDWVIQVAEWTVAITELLGLGIIAADRAVSHCSSGGACPIQRLQRGAYSARCAGGWAGDIARARISDRR